MKQLLITGVAALCLSQSNITCGNPAPKGWPAEVHTVNYRATVDGSQQPMLVYKATKKGKRPLLVGLHTWSGGYQQAGGEVTYADWCMANDWHFIHPHFRGPNRTPDACGSDKAVQDIVDAVEYMVKHHNVDSDRIYLVGVSGGGHAALLLAGRKPDMWAGVSAWVSISDIGAWWRQKNDGRQAKYARDIEKVVGGRPDKITKAAQECVKRSPITYLKAARGVNLDINAGVTDGHSGGSVPFTHALHAFNHTVPENDRIDESFITSFYQHQALPGGLKPPAHDPLYVKKKVLFRRVSKNTRVTIFQGGHEIIHHAALNWLAKQRKNQAAQWQVTATYHLKTDDKASQSGK